MIVISRFFIPNGYLGLTVFPFIFLKRKELRSHNVLLNHERIHLRQQLELLIILFFIIYVIEFIGRLIQFRNWKKAYRNISFEREAYSNEKDLGYISTRSFWKFIQYY
jgi:hypothetical protein